MRGTDFGGPLHILLIPGALHEMEREIPGGVCRVIEIQVFYNNLSGILEHPVLLAPMESLLGHTGDEILGMARCYLTDGTCFMKKNR